MNKTFHNDNNETVDKRTLGLLGRGLVVICIGVPTIIIVNLAIIWSGTGKITYVSPDRIFEYFFAHPTSEISAAIMLVFLLMYGLTIQGRNE